MLIIVYTAGFLVTLGVLAFICWESTNTEDLFLEFLLSTIMAALWPILFLALPAVLFKRWIMKSAKK